MPVPVLPVRQYGSYHPSLFVGADALSCLRRWRQKLPLGGTGVGTSDSDSLWDWGTGLPQRDSVFEHIWSDSWGM